MKTTTTTTTTTLYKLMECSPELNNEKTTTAKAERSGRRSFLLLLPLFLFQSEYFHLLYVRNDYGYFIGLHGTT